MKHTNMPKIIGLKELREHTESYIALVEKGKSFVVVRKSKPIFRLSPVDEWGDEGVWETALDFSQMKKGGMPISDFLKAVKKFNAKH